MCQDLEVESLYLSHLQESSCIKFKYYKTKVKYEAVRTERLVVSPILPASAECHYLGLERGMVWTHLESQLPLHKVHQMSFQARMEDTVKQEIYNHFQFICIQYSKPE